MGVMYLADATPTPYPQPAELIHYLSLDNTARLDQLWAWARAGLSNDWHEVRPIVIRALRRAPDDPLERLLLLRLAVECAHHASDNVQAVELAIAAEGLVETVQAPPGLVADLLYHKGNAHFRLSDSPRALSCGVEMLRIANGAGLERQQMYAHTLLGNVYFGAEQYPHALENFVKARAFAERCGDRVGQFRARFNEVWIHVEQGDGDTALARCVDLLELGQDLGGEREPMAHVKTAAVQVHLGLLDEAEPNVRAALGRALAMRPAFQLQALSIQASLHLKRGRVADARRVDQQLVELAEMSEMPRLQATALERLAETCAAAGDFAAAYKCHVRFHAVDRSNYRDAAEHRLRGLEMMLRLSQAEAEAEVFRARIEALREANQGLEDVRAELMRKNLEDPLTGIPNRRALDAALEAAVHDAETKACPLALLVLDLDHFKGVNDGFSHLIGDLVLQRFATILTEVIRGQDFAGRYGGEEFVAVLASATDLEARRVAERIRVSVERYDWESIAPELAVTVSIGVSFWSPGCGSEALLSEADAALYRAKDAGRNRVNVCACTGAN